MTESVVTVSGGGVSGDCAAAANGRVEGGIHMSRTGSVYSAYMHDDKDD